MRGTPGRILFKGNGAHVTSPDQLPEDFQAAVNGRFPGALDDAASWDG